MVAHTLATETGILSPFPPNGAPPPYCLSPWREDTDSGLENPWFDSLDGQGLGPE